MFLLGFVPQLGGILNILSKNEHSFVTRLVPPAKLLCACAIFCYIYWYLFRFGGLVGMLRKKESMVLLG